MSRQAIWRPSAPPSSPILRTTGRRPRHTRSFRPRRVRSTACSATRRSSTSSGWRRFRRRSISAARNSQAPRLPRFLRSSPKRQRAGGPRSCRRPATPPPESGRSVYRLRPNLRIWNDPDNRRRSQYPTRRLDNRYLQRTFAAPLCPRPGPTDVHGLGPSAGRQWSHHVGGIPRSRGPGHRQADAGSANHPRQGGGASGSTQALDGHPWSQALILGGLGSPCQPCCSSPC